MACGARQARAAGKPPIHANRSRPAIHAIRKLVHTEIIPIRWGDMDALGHVNNTLYFRYMEQARVAWYERMGLNERGPALPPNCGPVVIETGCTFLRGLRYPGDVEVQLLIGDPGRSSLMTYYDLRPSYDRGTVYAQGSAKACWIDLDKEKSIPLPQVLRALMDVKAPAG